MNVFQSYSSSLRTISNPAKLFLLSTISYWVGMTLVQLYLNFYLQGAGLDQGWIGLINAAPQLSTVVFTLVIGSVSARLGPWKATIVGTALAGAGIVGIALAPGAWTIFAASILNGLGGGFVWSNAGPFLMEHSRENTRSTLFSLQAALGTLTGFFAFMFGGQLPNFISAVMGVNADANIVLRVVIFGAAAFYLLSLVPVYFAGRVASDIPVEQLPAVEPSLDEISPRRKRRISISNPGLYFRLILPGSLVGLGAGMTIPFVNIYIERKFNIDFEGLGQLFAWTSIATAVALMVQPLLAEKFGKVKSVVLVQGASLPFLLVLGYSTMFPLVASALFVRGALMNMGNPIFSAYSMERIPARERATFSSLTSSTWALGWAVGAWFSGAIRDVLGFFEGFNVLFALMTALYGASMVLMWVWFVREESSQRIAARVEEKRVQAA
ncbi:MAG: MFS transporter [Chloroflexota bacterium]